MSLITYTEPINLGTMFVGIGSIAATIFFCVVFYKLFRPMIKWVEGLYNRDSRYWIVEEKMLDKIAKEKGIDIEEELLKREIVVKKNKSFRKKIEEEVFLKMFPEEKTPPKK